MRLTRLSKNAPLDQSVAALTDAFSDDPFFEYFIPDPDRRRACLTTIMRANLLLTLQAGQTFAAIEDDGRVAGCIGVLPPRAYPVSLVQGISFMSRLLFLPNPFNPSPAALLRGLPYLQAWDRLHHQVKFPHWYVFVVGVSPEFQGRGVGRQLMNPVLELADSDQCAIYLETQKQKNTGFYSRFGFELLSTEQPVTNGPTIHTMLRGA